MKNIAIAITLVLLSHFSLNAQFVGIGTATPAEKLDVLGNINLSGVLKIDNSSGVAGQVLVSNGASSPTWQSVANPRIGFRVTSYLGNVVNIPNFTSTHVPYYLYAGFPDINFNDGNGFDNSTGNYICPSAGAYSFEAQVSWPNITAPISLEIYKNGTIIVNTHDKLMETTATYIQTTRISAFIKCNAGDIISLNAFQVSGVDQSISNNASTYFHGYKIY
ncbi:MAG: hypothetical protein ABIN97_10215 [Ginsengibacter sp.]